MRPIFLPLAAAAAALGLLSATTAQTTPEPARKQAANLEADPRLAGWWKFDESSERVGP